jgi:hypothetical protein
MSVEHHMLWCMDGSTIVHRDAATTAVLLLMDG